MQEKDKNNLIRVYYNFPKQLLLVALILLTLDLGSTTVGVHGLGYQEQNETAIFMWEHFGFLGGQLILIVIIVISFNFLAYFSTLHPITYILFNSFLILYCIGAFEAVVNNISLII